jgi:hypothetical protein
MNGNLRNLWVGLAFQQVRSYRRVVTAMPKSVEASWPLEPHTRRIACRSQGDELLNPLEFHGKRQSERPQPTHD